jgi:hypothetical protein
VWVERSASHDYASRVPKLLDALRERCAGTELADDPVRAVVLFEEPELYANETEFYVRGAGEILAEAHELDVHGPIQRKVEAEALSAPTIWVAASPAFAGTRPGTWGQPVVICGAGTVSVATAVAHHGP